jgi:ribosomal protein S18 acetylase RimI-like enzyme
LTDGTTIRRGGPADLDSAVEVWRAANEASLEGRETSPPEHGGRVRGHLEAAGAFLFVADDGAVSGMAVGMQGLCHVGAVFVAPARWGEGLGGRLVDAVLAEARARGYARAQLWTHTDNDRARSLYARRGFKRTGREKADDTGETIAHYERDL